MMMIKTWFSANSFLIGFALNMQFLTDNSYVFSSSKFSIRTHASATKTQDSNPLFCTIFIMKAMRNNFRLTSEKYFDHVLVKEVKAGYVY